MLVGFVHCMACILRQSFVYIQHDIWLLFVSDIVSCTNRKIVAAEIQLLEKPVK